MSTQSPGLANNGLVPGEPFKNTVAPTSLMADLALKMSIMGLLAPGLWYVICVDHKWHATETIGWIGYVISAGIPILLTLATSRLAIQQLRQSETPLLGKTRVIVAIVLTILSPMVWIFANVFHSSGVPG